MTVWLVRIWTHKNADEKAHTLSRRSKNVKKRTKTYEKRILCKFTFSRLLFADDLVLLSSTESGLQRALNSFADACNTAGMKISTAKTEVLHLSRNPDRCVLQANGATLKQVEKFKYLGVAFTSDGRQDEELDTRNRQG